MKETILSLLLVLSCLYSKAQEKIIKDYGYFSYSFPKKNWTATDQMTTGPNKTWGCQTFDLGKTAN